jgi:hypothetical protein
MIGGFVFFTADKTIRSFRDFLLIA